MRLLSRYFNIFAFIFYLIRLSVLCICCVRFIAHIYFTFNNLFLLNGLSSLLVDWRQIRLIVRFVLFYLFRLIFGNISNVSRYVNLFKVYINFQLVFIILRLIIFFLFIFSILLLIHKFSVCTIRVISKQLFMITSLDNLTFFHHKNLISISNGG